MLTLVGQPLMFVWARYLSLNTSDMSQLPVRFVFLFMCVWTRISVCSCLCVSGSCEDDCALLTCSSAMILSPSSSSSCKVEVLTGGVRGLGLTSGGTRKGLGCGASSSSSYSQNNQPSVTDPHPPLCLSKQQKQLESLLWFSIIIILKNRMQYAAIDCKKNSMQRMAHPGKIQQAAILTCSRYVIC